MHKYRKISIPSGHTADKQTYIGDDMCGRVYNALASFTYRERERKKERQRMVERDPELLDNEALMDRQTYIGDDTCGRVFYALATFTYRERERERKKERKKDREWLKEILNCLMMKH